MEVTERLNRACEVASAALCYLMDGEGLTVAASTLNNAKKIVGQNYGFRPYFKTALRIGHGLYLAKGVTTKARGLYFSRRIESRDGRPLGVVVIKQGPEALEKVFRQYSSDVIMATPEDVIFMSNRQDWILRTLHEVDDEKLSELTRDRQFGETLGDSVDLVFNQDSTALDSEGREYLLGSSDITNLAGWRVLYLTDVSLIPLGLRTNRTVFVLMISIACLLAFFTFLCYRSGLSQLNKLESRSKALEESEEELSQFSQLAGDVMLVHYDGRIMQANTSLERLFGYQLDELKGMQVLQIISDESTELVQRNIVDDFQEPYEAEGMHKNGNVFPIEITATTIMRGGSRVRVCCIRDITDRKQAQQRQRFESHYDALTGLPSRNLMIDRLQHSIARSQRINRHVVVLFLDLDDFKKINESQGHDVGDKVLVAAAKRLNSAIRVSDTLARYGGDEFIVVLEDISDPIAAEPVAEKILAELSRPFESAGRSYFISASIGMSVYPTDGVDPAVLLQKADTAMHRSKESGRNTFRFFTDAMNDEAVRRLELEQQLREAMRRGEFQLHYQPIFATEERRLIGAEALLRWNNQRLGAVSPADFIPTAEQTGLIVEIGDWVLEEAARQTREWQDAGIAHFRIGVNVSPRQFRDGAIVHSVERVLEQTGVVPSALVIEITEGVLVRNDAGTEGALNDLKKMGVRLSMDDFGTGYSSLSYLKRFPFDTLKIDREFVRDLYEDSSDQQLVVATVAMAQGMGLQVVAEGVEGQEQLDFLKDVGCDSIQGFFLGQPMSADEFTKTFVTPQQT